jgi:predicted SAM-dependent methyltransferase
MAKIIGEIQYPCKIEVGSGGNPQSGYVHCDVDERMPHLEAVCRMGKEALPFPDNCASELLSNHSIEHVSWLDVEFVVKDWFRVLQPGGRLFLRTPDLEFICKTYLERKTTKEHPVDESNMVRIFGDCGPSEWANIKLFAGQNYSGNFHMFALDMDMATRLFTRCGFKKISRLNIQPVFSPGEIQLEAYKP